MLDAILSEIKWFFIWSFLINLQMKGLFMKQYNLTKTSIMCGRKPLDVVMVGNNGLYLQSINYYKDQMLDIIKKDNGHLKLIASSDTTDWIACLETEVRSSVYSNGHIYAEANSNTEIFIENSYMSNVFKQRSLVLKIQDNSVIKIERSSDDTLYLWFNHDHVTEYIPSQWEYKSVILEKENISWKEL